jgi:hypothetical protein
VRRLRSLGSALLAAAAVLCLGGPAVAAALPTLPISIAAGSIAVSGAPESGAVDIVATAASSLKEPSAVLVRLRPGVTVGELVAYLAQNLTGAPDTIAPYGSIVFNREVAPGSSTESETSLVPGTYVALDAEGEKSSRWAYTSFEVPAAADPARLPAPGAVERTKGVAFEGPRTLRRGELVRFENAGLLAHMDIAFRVRSRAAAQSLALDLRTGRVRAAEKLVAGVPANFAGALSPGGSQQERITAAPGWYVQACFLETAGRPNTRLGMERVIRIVS